MAENRFAVLSDKIDDDRRIFAVLKRLVSETGRKHIDKYLLSFLLTALVAGTTAAMVFLLEDVINGVFVDKNLTLLFSLSAAVLGIFLIRGFATFGNAVLLNQISNAIVLELKVKLFRQVISKEPSFFAGGSSGEMMMLVNNGAQSATSLMNTIALTIGRDVFTLIALLIVMFVQNWVVALTMLASVPIIALVVTGITTRLRNLSRRQLELGTALSNRIRGSIQGIKVVKAFAIESEMERAMEENAQSLRKLSQKQAVVSNRLAPFMEMIGGAIVAGCIAFGGWRVIEAGDTPGELISFVFAALMVYDPARRLSQARTSIEKALVGVRIMYDFMDREDVGVDRPGAAPLNIRAGEVRFENVSFAYTEDKPVLTGMDFVIPAGRTTAMVGRSGAGKTTVASLLLRFWQPTSGRILIDGQDILDVTVNSLRNGIAYVGQEGFLFDGTIRENIAVGRRDASFDDIRAAAQAAEAHDFIMSLPKGYDTLVGELGGNLSGGQRQRLAIARALLRDAAIVILDEPTSALDGETERAIQRSLRRLTEGRTTIVIAHRLSTIQNADQILVVDGGRIVEVGAHGQLIAAGGQYSRLYGEGGEEPKTVEIVAE